MKALFTLTLILFGATAHAQVGGPGLGLFNARPGSSLEYGYQISGAAAANGTTPSPQIDQHLLRGTYLVYREGKDALTLNAGVATLETQETIPFTNSPTIERELPRQLWDVGAGVGFNRELDSGRSLGGIFSVGSASDEPFARFSNTTMNFTGTYVKPVSENRAWVYALNWSNNRSFLNYIPLPFAAYQIREPSVGLFAFVGVPVILSLNPPESKVGYRLFILPSGLSSEMTYRIVGPVQVYGKAEWGQEVWMRAKRLSDKDRLIFDQKRVALGIRSPAPGGMMVDLAGSYNFDRQFIQGESVYKNNRERAELEPTWLITLRVNYMPDLFEAMKARKAQ